MMAMVRGWRTVWVLGAACGWLAACAPMHRHDSTWRDSGRDSWRDSGGSIKDTPAVVARPSAERPVKRKPVRAAKSPKTMVAKPAKAIPAAKAAVAKPVVPALPAAPRSEAPRAATPAPATAPPVPPVAKAVPPAAAPERTAPPSRPTLPSAPPAISPPPAVRPVQPPAKADPINGARLIEEARDLFRRGEVIGAREKLVSALTAPLPDVLLELARTYDPNYLDRLPKSDADADIDRARALYEQAVALGNQPAQQDLQRLQGR